VTGSATGPISILIVDDHTLFRQSLAALLTSQPGLCVVADHGSIQPAIHALETQTIDLVLLDYDLRGERGDALLEWLRENEHPARVLMVAATLDADQVLDLIREGATGILLKDKPVEVFLEAVRTVAAGGKWLDQELAGPVMTAAARVSVPEALTDRERTTLRGVLEGLSNKEIGDRMRTSETAVKATLQRMFDKTGVRTRGQLIRIALSKRYEPLP